MEITIAGAGVAGLASAALLARHGHDVRVIDQFPAPAPVGSGLMLQPVGMAVLDRLGLVDRTLQVTSPISQLFGTTGSDRRILDVRYADLTEAAEGRAIQRSEVGVLPIAAWPAQAEVSDYRRWTGSGTASREVTQAHSSWRSRQSVAGHAA